jgi:hypothetical protein
MKETSVTSTTTDPTGRDRRSGPLTDSSPCGFGPSVYCVDGPLDDTRVRPLRRKEGRVHPVYRTARGHVIVGEPDDGEPHYVLRNHGWLGDASYYEYVQPGPVGCTDCGARFEMVALIGGRWVSMDTPGAHDAP